MTVSLFSFVPQERIYNVLNNLQEFTGLAVQLIENSGKVLMSFGGTTNYCSILKKKVFNKEECVELHIKAGQIALHLGESYIFCCHANLHHIAFPLINQGDFLGSIIIGPFLIDKPDCTVVSIVAEQYHLTANLALELNDELAKIAVLSPTKVNQLKKLMDNLLMPLFPGERYLLIQNQKKMSQQAKLNEAIQVFKEEKDEGGLDTFYLKEQNLLSQFRFGTITEAKALLNDLIGFLLFHEGNQIENVRIYCLELTILLSRESIDGGAKINTIHQYCKQFCNLLLQEKSIENLCDLIREIIEIFMNAMLKETDKGNPHIRKALRLMADNYSHHLQLNRVAKYVGLSPSYFSSLFRQIVGDSFSEYLCKIRVEKSKLLLLSQKYALMDIAIAMGFPDQSYYCKAFKRIVGVTPGKYRGTKFKQNNSR